MENAYNYSMKDFQLKQILRCNLYRKADEFATSEELSLLYQYEQRLLKNIEPLFHGDRFDNTIELKKTHELIEQFTEEKNNADKWAIEQKISIDNKDYKLINNQNNILEYILPKVSNSLKNLVNSNKTIRHYDNKDVRYYFNSILNKLFIDRNIFPDKEYFENNFPFKKQSMTKVFLSYAYIDKLYTYPLFIEFYKYGIYLYIDWMHNDKFSDGTLLKNNLTNEMKDSKQLLLLLSPHNELNLKGNPAFRNWCSWELGNYYKYKKGQEKYFINIYGRYSNKNMQIQGIKKLEGITDSSLLFGY